MPLLRPLTHDDLDELIAIEREASIAAFSHIFPQDTHPWNDEAMRERRVRELDDAITSCFAIVDTETGHLNGFAATQGDQFLHFLMAKPTWGSGLAGQAHDEIVDHLRTQGHQRIWLWCLVENRRAMRFYTARGWQPTGTVERSTYAPYPEMRRLELDL